MACVTGYWTAINIWQEIIAERHGLEPDFIPWTAGDAVMAIAIGTQAVCHDTGGVTFGKETLKNTFGTDLSLKGTSIELVFREIF